MVEKEIRKRMSLTWGEAAKTSQDRIQYIAHCKIVRKLGQVSFID